MGEDKGHTHLFAKNKCKKLTLQKTAQRRRYVLICKYAFGGASFYCWFARDNTAAIVVVKNKSISLPCEVNSIFT